MEKVKQKYLLYSKISVPITVDNYDNESDKKQLHVFCGASAKTFGAAAYFVKDNLFMAKNTAPPLKKRILPQL